MSRQLHQIARQGDHTIMLYRMIHENFDFKIKRVYSNEFEVSHPKVTSLVEDLFGNIWASTYSGLSVYNPTDGSIKFIHKPQGILNHEFN